MGGKNMFAVMSALDGVDITVPWGKGERKTKTKQNGVFVDDEYRHLGADELLLLLTIAYRQRDPDESYSNEDCICYADPATLTKLSRISRSSLYKARRVLIESGLVTFSPSKRCKSVDNPNKTTSYTNVWHIDVNHLYRQRLMAGTVHNGDKAVHNGDKAVHNGDKAVHNGDKVVHNGDTNNTIDNTNNNTKTTPGGVDVIRAFIAETFAIPITGIGVAGLRKATKGKPLSAVADTVRKFKAAQGSVICQKDGQVQGVGLLMDALKAIPREKTPKEMSEEEISALFSAPAKIPETTSGNKAYQDGWKQLKEHLKLTELDQDDLDETKYAYARRFGELGDADVVASIDKFLKDLPGEHGTSIADLCAAIPDAAERGTYLRNALNKN